MSADPKLAQELFLRLAELPLADQLAALDRECQGNAELRDRVAALLKAHAEPDSFLDRSGSQFAATLIPGPPAGDGDTTDRRQPDPDGSQEAPPPDLATTEEYRPQAEPAVVIAGRYTLVEKIGEGGMGEVWVAKQIQPVKRRVALKLIKAGMDSKAVLARFEQERQALAIMDHPNIARVLDGGMTADGRPFFVMELVNGLSITKFCDTSRLTPRERLEVFVPVCQAVQHAHQKGIVHRDLKPSNILVTLIDGRPIPKVIDFGVAKAVGGKLTDETLATQFGAVVGTLEYMAPEQAGFSGIDVDTRADIYSLGVILYELLTGLRPIDGKRFREAALSGMVRILKDEEPSKPSTRLSTDASLPSLAASRKTEPKRLMAMLRGELDWVVMKCLEKDRDRRYETANGLARDIQRFLGDEAVEARPPSALYRMRKFVRRNKVQVISAGLIVATLVAGIVGTTAGMIRANSAETAAQNEVIEKGKLARKNAELYESESEARARAERNEKTANERAGSLRRMTAQVLFDKGIREHADGRLADGLAILRQSVALTGTGDSLEATYRRVLADRCLQGEKQLAPPLHHLSEVICTVFSPDGTRILTGCSDGSAWLWDARTGMPLGEPLRHPEKVSSVAFSPDGARLLTGSEDKVARLWDARSGALLGTPMRHAPDEESIISSFISYFSCQFSPDGSRVATGSWDAAARIWDAFTGAPLGAIMEHDGPVVALAFSPDGESLATASGQGTVRMWDARSMTPLKPLGKHDGTAECLGFSSDGARLATGGLDGTARIWDARTGEPVCEPLKHKNPVHRLTFSPGGGRLLTVSYNRAHLWDADSGKSLGEPLRHEASIESVAFSPDGMTIATASSDKTASLWDAKSAASAAILCGMAGGSGASHSLRTAPAWSREAPTRPRVWTAQQAVPRREIGYIAAGVRHVAVARSGTPIVTLDNAGDALLWDARTGRSFGKPMHSPAMETIQISPDGTRVVGGNAVGREPRVVLWMPGRANPVGEPMAHETSIKYVLFSPDGTRLLTASGNRNVRLLDAQTAALLAGPLQNTVQSPANVIAAFSPDSLRLLVSLDEQTVQLWNAQSGVAFGEPMRHGGAIRSAVFDPQGARIAIVGQDQSISFWDGRSGAPVGERLQFDARILQLVFSPDGTRFVTITKDNFARLWDADQRTALADSLPHDEMIVAVEFSPDGSRFVTGTRDLVRATAGAVRLWDARTAKLIAGPLPNEALIGHPSFTPDGTRLFTTRKENPVIVRDGWTLALLGEPLRATDGVSVVTLSRDGAELYTRSSHSAQIWDARGFDIDSTSRSALEQTFRLWTGFDADEDGTIRRLGAPEFSEIYRLSAGNDPLQRFMAARHATQTETYHRRAADVAERAHWWHSAAQHLRELGKLFPGDAELQRRLSAAVSQAAAAGRAGDIPRADDPQDGPAYIARGSKHWQAKNFDRALADFDEAIRLNPKSGSAYRSRGMLRNDRREFDLALQDFDTAIRLDQMPFEAYTRRGWTRFQLNELDKAIDDYTEAICIFPQYSQAHYDRAVAYERLGRNEDALRDLSFLVESRPKEVQGWIFRARFLARTGDATRAAQDFARAFELNPDDVMLAQLWANLILYAGDTQGYRQACARIRSRFGDPKEVFRKIHVAWPLMQGPDAIDDPGFLIVLCEKTVELDPQGPWSQTALAGSYLRNGKFDSALRALDESDRLGSEWPSRPINDLLRAIVLVRLGRVAEGRKVFETAAKFGDENLKSNPEAPFGKWSALDSWYDWYTFQIFRHEAEALLRDADASGGKE